MKCGLDNIALKINFKILNAESALILRPLFFVISNVNRLLRSAMTTAVLSLCLPWNTPFFPCSPWMQHCLVLAHDDR